jgi:hypothetical protein
MKRLKRWYIWRNLYIFGEVIRIPVHTYLIRNIYKDLKHIKNSLNISIVQKSNGMWR